MNLTHKTLLLTFALATPLAASAYEQGDTVLRIGPLLFAPDVGTDAGTAGIDVDDNVQLGLTASYLVHPNVGVEIVAATPFYHDISLGGPTIGSTKHLPPTAFVQWYPMADARVQPFLGVGVNHTFFFDEKSGLGRLKLDDSTGIAFEAGVDVAINDQLSVNATVWKIDINTDVSLNGAPLGELELDPFVALVGVAMKF